MSASVETVAPPAAAAGHHAAPPREQRIYGVLGEFDNADALLAAAHAAYAAGWRRLDAYTPIPIDGLAAAIGRRRSWVPLIVMVAGFSGAAGGYFMQWFSMTYDYPYNIGGRPFHSWPMFIPITFELGILCGSVIGALSMLALNGLPRPHHPLFKVPGFERATIDRFFLCLEASDPKFENTDAVGAFLKRAGAVATTEVEA
ncbi:MAG: DUF3341 domain-containing protein [Verrucomicrobia bacterium]|nr:DUF3341 domain-containing protein [Verrucomicrobiota bacterium]